MKKKTFFNQLIQEKVTVCEFENRTGTAMNYRSLLHYIEQRFGLVEVKNVNPHFAAEMKAQMVSEKKSPSTIVNYFNMLGAIYNYAVYKRLAKPEDFPFQRKPYELDKVKKPKPNKRTECYLTKKQMQTLYDYWLTMPTDKSYWLNRKKYLGMFLISYLCNGANIADIHRLTYNHEYFNNDGKILSFVREKVKNRSAAVVRIPVIPQLRVLLDYFAQEPKNNGLVFDFAADVIDTEIALRRRICYDNTRIRDMFVQIGNDVIGRDDITVTYARHSYSSVLHHTGCNFAIVEQNLGHQLQGVAGNYIGQQTIDELFKVNANLL